MRKLFFVAEFVTIVSMVEWCRNADTENRIFIVEVLTLRLDLLDYIEEKLH